ncbi:hypothetical protein A4D02_00860 [Niastella koreensis]|uniref:Secretion system C-terminal sorting domain-containing protein n=2 Tax=Niastella koreensis TaxID=354356 RepID=G8TCK1_NIAKG|nr:T9SS type A sorting domain-containing protein [Niastella koreensis]AEW02541.1 hypothetical protein Niako_6316 [Niastella koreensis GR20-10]OQP54905.1 hypothetical protein A4D02_00860 [Niastella koreensis]
MKKFNILIIFLLIITNCFSQFFDVNFKLCPGNQTACNAFISPFTCGNGSIQTMYGAPKLMNYTWDNSGTPTVNQVVKLTGTKSEVNGVKVDVDEGFEFEYIFKPNRNYLISVTVSGLKDNNGTNVIAGGEVILGSQYSTQNTNGCSPDQFDFQKNNGTVVLSFTPTSYSPTTYQANYITTNVNLSKVKVRCRNTLDPNPPIPNNPAVNNSYLLIYSVSIQEGTTQSTDNLCNDRNVTIGFDIDWDFANPPSGPYWAATMGSYYSTTVVSNIHISNGMYRIVSNNNIFLKPGFHGSVGTNGIIRASIGRCKDGEPLRVATNQNVNNRPIDSTFYNKVVLFPNPARTELNVLLKENIMINQIFVTDNLGRKIRTKTLKTTPNKITVDVSSLNNGVYFLSFMSKSSLQTYKFIVNK